MQPANTPKFDIAKRATQWAVKLELSIRQAIEGLRYKLTHLPETNYDLGMHFAKQGKLQDAILRFRVSLYFAPQYTKSWYQLGRCYLAANQREKAIEAFKNTLRLEPTHGDAKYLLATLNEQLLAPQDRPQKMPSHMMEDFFSTVAHTYDDMEKAAGYRLPHACFKWLRPRLKTIEFSVLDLGCGTGLSALPWRKEAKTIVGVDCIAPMAERARYARIEGAAVFDAVVTLDAAAQHFQLPHAQSQAGFDVVLLINVLSYVGEPTALLRNAAAQLKPEGFLLITLEPYAGDAGFGVVAETSRFGHKVEYITHIVSTFGLVRAEQNQMDMYENVKVSGVLFTKSKASA